MRTSVNIILDYIRDLRIDNYIDTESNISFTRTALLTADLSNMNPDYLYICKLSDYFKIQDDLASCYFICINDSAEIPDDDFNNLIIVNEKMKLNKLFNLVTDLFYELDDWYRSMQDSLIHEKSVQTILDLSEHIIGNTINISDSTFNLIAHTTHVTTDDALSLKLVECGYHPDSTLNIFREKERYKVWKDSATLFINQEKDFTKYNLVNKVFRFSDLYFAHVVMVCDHHPLSKGLVELFEILVDILSIYAEKNWKEQSVLSHVYDDLIVSLISGMISDKDEAEAYASQIALPYEGKFILVELFVDHAFEDALGRIQYDLLKADPVSPVLKYKQSIITLISLSDGKTVKSVKNALDPILRKHGAIAGISSTFDHLFYLNKAYLETTMAIKYNNWSYKNHFITESNKNPQCEFNQIYVFSLIGENPKSASIWRQSDSYKMLVTLYQSDKNHGTDNLKMLYTYLKCERKATETGQILNMHRNNVIYHIDKIQSMLDIDLNDASTRLGLTMSFILLDMYGYEEADIA